MSAGLVDDLVERRALTIRGVVQGVGFRPAMYRLAAAHSLAGFVRNEIDSVRIEIEGDRRALAKFTDDIAGALPPAARLDSIEREPVPVRGETAFRIEPSCDGAAPSAPIPADRAPCDACIRELEDPADRRFRYPFVSCTDCGPRFTIVRALPYDRARTTMDAFALCDACSREHHDPADRRFHDQPSACAACGPELRWVEGGRARAHGDEALSIAARAITAGAIVALKAAGGFALAVDARDARAVRRLRERKRRPSKPFAVMVRDLDEACRIAIVDADARAALTSASRPIVLLERRQDAGLAASVAPRLPELGVFLPATPLQHLLLRAGPAAQVMTSGNRMGEPIAIDDDVALRTLAGIADGFLLHDRPIHARADDSVVRMIGGSAVVLRRARGLVPEAIELPFSSPPILGVGGQTKSTVCLSDGRSATLSQHLGDLDHPDALASFEDAVGHLRRLTGITPLAVAHDLHPDYRSTRWALASGLRAVGVQHHHAHVASCMIEHGRIARVLGVALDGTGYGADGALWGGEILDVDLAECRRLGRFRPLALAGGEAAIRQPWRVALAALIDAGESLSALDAIPAERAAAVRAILESGMAPRSSGAGRWLDAVAAIAGVRHAVEYDGQAAIELEGVARAGEAEPYELAIDDGDEGELFELDLRPAIRGVAADVRRRAGAPEIAARFHETIARAIAAACRRARSRGAPDVVALTGGCFANRRIAERATALLSADGFDVIAHRRVPPNDGGLALGQAAIAGFRLARDGEKAV